jgi:competence protein ComEC
MLLCLLGSALAGTLTLDMLDVGQGDALLITTPDGQHILVDAGTARARVADTLSRLGVEKLDLIVASHPHADHIGGMKAVVERFPIGGYYHSGDSHTTRTYRSLEQAIQSQRIESRAAKSGQVFQLGQGATMKVLWPGTLRLDGTRSDLNSNSVVLRIDNGKDCMLFMGDAEEPTERAILRHNFQSCDLLKVAHHGSRHSSSQRFLTAVDPSIALISVGDRNRYKHPGDSTVAKLHGMDVAVYRSDLTGHVTVVSTGNGLRVIDGLPDSAPLRANRPVAKEPTETGPTETGSTETGPVAGIIDLRNPEDASTVLSVEPAKDSIEPPQPVADSSWQRFLNHIAFWRPTTPSKDNSK